MAVGSCKIPKIRACVSNKCTCCSETCFTVHWIMTLAGMELAVALLMLARFALYFLAHGIHRRDAADPALMGFFYITQVLETGLLIYNIVISTAIIVTMCSFHGPARRHELETKRVETPLPRTYVVVYTVLLSIAMALTGTLLVLLPFTLVGIEIVWDLDFSVGEILFGLLLDFEWCVLCVGVRARAALQRSKRDAALDTCTHASCLHAPSQPTAYRRPHIALGAHRHGRSSPPPRSGAARLSRRCGCTIIALRRRPSRSTPRRTTLSSAHKSAPRRHVN